MAFLFLSHELNKVSKIRIALDVTGVSVQFKSVKCSTTSNELLTSMKLATTDK